jgi:16S rRNA (guanine527-N7)-methyltransferase
VKGSDIIKHYFPELTEKQIQQFDQLKSLYDDWNSQINVISRKDMDEFYIHHVLHSLGIAKVNPFKAGTTVMDIGTGGGFPGIPLAILFPETQFHLVDSIGKKIKVVEGVKTSLGLSNVTSANIRGEKVKGTFDFVISRAVARLGNLHHWVKMKIKPGHTHKLANGMLLLKGGDLSAEIEESELFVQEFPLSKYFSEPFLETKKVIYVPYTEK